MMGEMDKINMIGGFESFHSKCPKIASAETKVIINLNDNSFPKGEYIILENYCNDKDCDCRKVMINIVKEDEIFATIGYGWEKVEYYQEWVRDKKLGIEMKGPSFEVAGKQSEYAKNILIFLKSYILKDPIYIKRLKKHYKLFKDKIKKENPKPDINSTDKKAKILEEINIIIKKTSVLDLCDEIGTGFSAINKENENAFYPILFSIEETIYHHIKKDSSLEDSNIIDSLKKLRDNIFSEKTVYNALEKEIIDNIKKILYVNSYDRKDALLSISKVLNSVKLHRSMGGKRGYLDFIAEFIENSKGSYEYD